MRFQFFIPKNVSFPYIHLLLSIDIEDNILFHHQEFKLKIPFRMDHEDWDSERQRPLNIYLKKHKKINTKLDELKVRITEYAQQKLKEGKDLSQRTISRIIKKVCSEKLYCYPELSLIHFTQLYIENRKDLISYNTYKRYKVFLHLLQKLEGFTRQRFIVDSIGADFLKNLISFGKVEGYSENTIHRTLNFIRTILNFAERKGIRTAVRELEIRKEKKPREMVTLSEQEILAIKAAVIPKELQAAKDWLLVSCYTGQRISDFMEFSENKIIEIEEKKCLSFTQKKTGKPVLLPLHQIVINVLKRNEGKFPPRLSSAKYNNDIREVARFAGVNTKLKARKRIGFRSMSMVIEKWQTLSSHIGRRSFATNFYGKIPTPLLMEATGHSTEQMFLKYINPLDHSKTLRLSRYFDKMYQKRIVPAE